MRTLILATSVALALGSAPAIAQSGLARVTTANTNTPASSSSTGTAVSSLAAEPRVTAAPSAPALPAGSSAVAGGSSNAFGTNTTASEPTNSQPSFGPGGSFSNDSGNTALGTSPGQTSSGTAAGNSSAGIGAGSATLDPASTGSLGAGPAASNPDGTVLGTGVNAVGERVPVAGANGTPSGQQSPTISIVNTPTFDQAAREGRAREQARKARGIEPRVYGIAPRTENDLTWQMPDDRIIRY